MNTQTMAVEATIEGARDEARRQLTVCNACRYCEGYCDVFPAMERRRAFTDGELDYLANLCHNCRGCYYACQYAPPHRFQVNLPTALEELRHGTYEAYAWPKPLGRLFQANGLILSLATALGLALVLILSAILASPGVLHTAHEGGNFYAVIPHQVMVLAAGVPFGFSLLALFMGVRVYLRKTGDIDLKAGDWARGLHHAFTLKNLGGGGGGCHYPDPASSNTRKRYHHFTFYGFMLCFAATAVGTVYHYGFGWEAPYGWLSLPVILGTLGGVGLLIGPIGLITLKFRADLKPAATRLMGMDMAFLALLLLISLSGLLLLGLRETAAMGWLLAIHLGFVLALFVALPYSKFVHGFYRIAALARNAGEARRSRI